jgi:phosphohistidine phosphatase SixA
MRLRVLYLEDVSLPLRAVEEEASVADVARVTHKALMRKLVVKLYGSFQPNSVWNANKTLPAIGSVVNCDKKSSKWVFQ